MKTKGSIAFYPFVRRMYFGRASDCAVLRPNVRRFMLLAFRTTKFQTKNKHQMKDKISNETETANSIKPVVKSSFSREEVIKLLDWLRSSNFHNQGCNGWNQYGHSAYYGVSSDYVLREGEKNCF